MVMTILKARVSEDNRAILERVYLEGIQHKDAGIVQTFLIHSLKETDLWSILTVWQSREALDEMRSSGETPRGVLMFRSAKAEPTLSIYDVAQHAAW